MADLPKVGLIRSSRHRKHPQANLRGIQVDKKLVPLLEALWDSGFDTQWSCQGHPVEYAILPIAGYSYILFYSSEQAFEFLQRTGPKINDVQDMMSIRLQLMTDGRGGVQFPPALLDEITNIWTC